MILYNRLVPPVRCRRVRMPPRRVILVLCGIAAATVIIGTLASSTSGSNEDVDIEMETKERPRDESSIRLIVVGDTGGIPLLDTTRAQRKTALQMALAAGESGLDAVVNMGDNIYFTGVSDVMDSRFESSFEEPYRSKSLDVPWYMMAGNHDHFGNVTAQVEYSKYSKKWTFPSLYYNVSFATGDGATSVDLIMLDTIVLCGNSRDIEYAGFWKMMWAKSHEPTGPTNKTAAEEQWAWLEKQLNASRADYLLVAGHYPIHSVSSHGPTKCVKERLDPLLMKYGATVYLSGHDHTLQHISYPSTHGGGRLHYIVSGAGSRADPSKKHAKTVERPGILHHHFPKSGTIINQLGVSDGGFAYVAISSKGLHLQFLDGNGHLEYDTVIPSRKKEADTVSIVDSTTDSNTIQLE